MVSKHNIKGRYLAKYSFYGRNPNYGYTKADAEKVEKLAKRVEEDLKKLKELFAKAESEDKRWER